jgi:hypothetical protein
MDSVAQGVALEDVRNALIQDSTFTNNGTGDVLGTQQHILITALTNPNLDDLDPGEDIEDILLTDPDFDSFVYTIQRTMFIDTATVIQDDAVLIQTVGADAARSRLELQFIDNEVDMDRLASLTMRPAALEIDWNGYLAADINRNIVNIIGTGNGQTGFRIATQGLDTRSDLNVISNIITGAGDGDADALIGVDIALVGPANISVNQNAIDFVTPSTLLVSNNFGLRFRFTDGNKNVDVVDNLIVMDEGTAMFFQPVASPIGATSSFFIEGNQIGTVARAPDQGIIFQSVTGVINLLGTRPNITPITPGIVTPAIFFVPPGTSVGQINVNGFFVP